jgi:hypothetical protein
MSTFAYFWWLFDQFVSSLSFYWFVSLPAAFVAFVAACWLLRHRPFTPGAVAAFVLGLCAPAVVLIAGALLRAEPRTHSETGGYVDAGLLLLTLVGFMACIACASRQRTAVTAFVLAMLWPALMASFVAGMSMAGDWL